MDSPSDSVLSMCAKRTGGGWEMDRRRAVGGIKRKGGAGELAGTEVLANKEGSERYKGFIIY